VRLRLYVRPEIVVWIGLTVIGTAVSVLSGREMVAGIDSVRRVALHRPHAEDVLRMAQHNLVAEYGRTVAQALFLTVGVVALFSKPQVRLGRPRLADRVLPWVIVLVEGILVGNSVNEYVLSRRVLRRRASIQARSNKEGSE
jgi:hypothetical protein